LLSHPPLPAIALASASAFVVASAAAAIAFASIHAFGQLRCFIHLLLLSHQPLPLLAFASAASAFVDASAAAAMALAMPHQLWYLQRRIFLRHTKVRSLYIIKQRLNTWILIILNWSATMSCDMLIASCT
jgi:hypothetical protein